MNVDTLGQLAVVDLQARQLELAECYHLRCSTMLCPVFVIMNLEIKLKATKLTNRTVQCLGHRL